MAKLPPVLSATALAIYASFEQKQRSFHSWGISISSLGDECDRALWYAFRHAYAPERKEGRMLRLFETGEIEEIRLLDDLRRIGCTVSGEQARVSMCGGHSRGKIDAECLGLLEAPKTVHVVECKSHNTKNFKAVSNDGVQKGKYVHYVQTQAYMHLRQRERGLYMAVCKDTDELHCERLEYDPVFCLGLEARAQRIIDAARPPAKLHEDPSAKMAFACKFCAAKAQCHEKAWPEHNCRTCLHSGPVDGGKWHCVIKGELARDDVAKGCPLHLYVPDLVPGEQIDADPERLTVTYAMPGGGEWVDGLGVQP